MAAEQAYHDPRTEVTPPRPCAGFFSEVSMETGCESSPRRGDGGFHPQNDNDAMREITEA